MYAIVPILCLLLLFLALRKIESTNGISQCWRSSFLSASVLWVFLLMVATELLSLFDLIKFSFVLGFWFLATVVSAVFYFRSIKISQSSPQSPESKLSFASILMLAGIVIIVIIVGFISLLCPPNN